MSAILVTGANKGLGLELVARLAQTQPNDTILLGSRSVKNGEAALQTLEKRKIAIANVKILEIDVTSQASVDAAAAVIKKDYVGNLSTIYSNAGVYTPGDDYHAAKSTMQVNYYGVKRIVQSLGPLIEKGGHHVVVSSGMGAWATYVSPTALQETLRTPQPVENIDELVELYLSALNPETKDAQSIREKFPDPAGFLGVYAMSKAFLNNYIQTVAATELEHHGNILVAVCPGYCATDLNANSGPRKAATGAWSIASAAQTSTKEAGGFFRDGKPAQYCEKPQTMEEMVEDAKTLEHRLEQENVLLL